MEKDNEGRVVSNEAADPDASYTSKRGQKYYGHKIIDIVADKNKMIKKVQATTAKKADTAQLDNLTQDKKHYYCCRQWLYYMSKAKKQLSRTKGVFYCVVERRVRGHSKLRNKQKKNNQHFAFIRTIGELPFVFIRKANGLQRDKIHRIREE